MEIVNDSNFKERVLDATLPVLVDFYADWCGPCQMMAPIMEELEKDYEGRVKIVKLNVNDSPNTSDEYNIMSIPVFILFRNGKAVKVQKNRVPKATLSNMLDEEINQ